MKKIFPFILFFLLASFQVSHAEGIKDLTVDLESGEITVGFRFEPAARYISRFKNEISREIVFYIDLFRRWEVWPDEFIRGVRIVRKLHSDEMKKEYRLDSFDGNHLTVRRFNSFTSMTDWAFRFNGISLGRLDELQRGRYFVRVTVESKKEKVPSIISEIFFFLPSREFRYRLDSPPFYTGSGSQKEDKQEKTAQ
jgi:hypothetical protein